MTFSALSVVGGTPPAGSATALPMATRLGFYPGYSSVAKLRSLEAWMGRDAAYVVQFADTRSSAFVSSVWGEVVNAGALQTVANQVTLVESIPLAFGSFVDASTAAGQATARASLQATLSGAHDVQYRTAAGYLRTGGYPDAIIRLGWEFDGGWMPWSSRGNEALWIQAYRHVVSVFRAVSPSFRFDWTGDAGYLQNQVSAYPGDDVVDIIGLDVYDKGMGGATAWNATTKSWIDPAAAWAKIVPSLAFQRDFAIAHGKPVSFPEWALTGVSATATSNVGGDDPTFVQGMSDWIRALPPSGSGSLVYESYFNEDTPDGNHQINAPYFPKAQLLYRAAFGATITVSATTNVNPSVTGQPVTLTATATDPGGNASTTGGTMKFYRGSVLLGSAVVSNGVASLSKYSTALLLSGDNSITARFFMAAGSPSINSAPVIQHVNPASTALSSTAPASTVFGQPFRVIAAVKTVAPGAGTPTGSVTLTNSVTLTSASRPLVAGRAVFTITGLAVGSYTFSLQYGGSSKYAGTSSTLTEAVGLASSGTTLTATPAIAVVGTAVTFTATVRCQVPCSAVPTGTVSFTDGSTALGAPKTLSATGIATFTTSALAHGTHSITAAYSGNGGIGPSSRTMSKSIS